MSVKTNLNSLNKLINNIQDIQNMDDEFVEMALSDVGAIEDEIYECYYRKLDNTPQKSYKLYKRNDGGYDAIENNASIGERNELYPFSINTLKNRYGVYLSVSGKDVKFLEYGTGTLGVKNSVDVGPGYTYNTGPYVKEYNMIPEGIGWFHKNELHVGNEPMAFIKEAIENVENDMVSDNVKYHLTKKSIGAAIERELKK